MAIPTLFVAAAVSGVAGCAFGALALASAGWCYPDPVAMVGIRLVCSIAIQMCSVARLCAHIDANAFAPCVLGRLADTPLGTWMLLHLQAARLGALLGAMLLAWCVFMPLRRPGWTLRCRVAGDLLAGARDGVTSCVAAFPGAVRALGELVDPSRCPSARAWATWRPPIA